MKLPPALAPWADSLAVLTPDLAIGLGPLIRGIDQLVASREVTPAEQGVLDGFDGLSRRGHPDLLLASEWLLADEAPEEFLRRAAQRELLHLAPAVSTPLVRGRVTVLADTGPGQAGAGRLVQLAGLIVLHRRATAQGAELAVGILGDEPGSWRTGQLSDLLKEWLSGRRPAEPDAGGVAAWGEDAWIFTGPRLAARLGARRRVLSSVESRWAEDGATHVRIAGGAELALPEAPIAVRALRGNGLRGAARPREQEGPLRSPIFPSAAPRILAKGARANELVSVDVTKGMGTSRVHELDGPVLAASVLGRRIVALIERDGMIRTQMIGNGLGKVANLAIPTGRFQTDDRLAPLYYESGELLCRFGDVWWRLKDSMATRAELIGVGASMGTQFDQPYFADSTYVHIGGRLEQADRDKKIVFGGGGYAQGDDRTWRTRSPRKEWETLTIEPGSRVLGLVFDGEDPGLVTATRGGVLVRLVGREGSKTLLSWSGLREPPIVHPTLPLIAGIRDDGRLVVGEVFDTAAGQ